MRITCPHCAFSKELPVERIPTDATTVSCPKCGQKFALEAAQEIEQQEQVPVAPTPVEAPKPAFAPGSTLSTQPDMRSVPKAGFWLRVVATLVDTVIILILQLGLGFLLGLAGVVSTGQLDGSIAGLVQLFGYVLSFAYYVVFTGHGGQTPGKMALRIKVVRTDGSEVGYGRAALREIPCKFISGILLCIGYIMVAFDEQKQGLHDRMAGTYVIKL